jgi:hypothetical protein
MNHQIPFKQILIFGVLLSLLSTGCAKKMFPSYMDYSFESKTGRPNYEELDYWASHPYKKDLGDSVPKDLQSKYNKDSSVDVFFVHPTTFAKKADQRNIAAIDDAALNKKTDGTAILNQASVFNASCRIFAPRYRQAHYRNFSFDKVTAQPNFDTAYADVKNAFEYYLKNYNKGRPIIIASHSQGTLHAARLLKEFFDGKALQRKLVCSYIIGLPVRENLFTTLPPCVDSTKTGCIISWRSIKEGYEGPDYMKAENFSSIVVNPLTWTTGNEKAPRSLNKGGLLFNFNKLKPNLVSAQVHKNILWTSKPKFFGNIFLNFKNYHIADYNFFYMNIRTDVERRIDYYWKQ